MAEEIPMQRRSFFRSALALLLTTAAAMIAWGIARFSLFGVAKERLREVPADVVEKLQPGAPAHVPNAGAWLLRADNGKDILALDDRCPHLGCRPRWNEEAQIYQCPCHGSEFDRDGNPKRGPATRGMSKLGIDRIGEDRIVLREIAAK
ncbi:MAG: Rieske (2Fe-2S) protein [Deltaproteobacteria bacterium]|nr:Rieske (2Fe-2S) protein [Deltaproteobacteria bacterium]